MTPATAPDDQGHRSRHPERQQRREQEERHHELREVVAQHLALVEPSRQQMRLTAQRPRHRLRLVVVCERGEVAPLPPAADLDHARTELQPEHEPPHQYDHHCRRRLIPRAEERGEEAGLQQQHLPPEAVERLPDAGDRHVPEPQREEAQHRHPRRRELRNADHEQHGDDDAGPAQRRQSPVGVPDAVEERGAQHPPSRLRRGSPFQQRRRRQQPALPEQRTELIQRRHERDEVQRRDAPLEHLARETEVDSRETVHLVRLRAIGLRRPLLPPTPPRNRAGKRGRRREQGASAQLGMFRPLTWLHPPCASI